MSWKGKKGREGWRVDERMSVEEGDEREGRESEERMMRGQLKLAECVEGGHARSGA